MRQFSLKDFLSASRFASFSLLVAILSFAIVLPARAQSIARVAAIQRISEIKSGASVWERAKAGAALKTDDAFRTGRRSKADIKFNDGSLVRLGQLSSIELRTNKGVTLLGGQLLYVALKPGRVLAGTAAAEIKGSSLAVRMNADGSVDFELLSGAVTITSPLGTVDLKPGQGVTVYADGRISPLREASPAGYLRGFRRSELYDAPLDSPYIGSRTHEIVRLSPERPVLDDNVGLASDSFMVDFFNPFTSNSSNPSTPLPSPTPTGGGTGGLVATVNMQGRQIAMAPETDAARGGDVAETLRAYRDTSAAERHWNETDFNLGSTYGGDVQGIGIFGDGGARIYGGRAHGYMAKGKLFFDVALQPLRVRLPNNQSIDYSSVPSGFINYRDERGDITLGRQRFVAGPTQSTIYGSMIRAGTRETMDALRIAPKLPSGLSLDMAYLIDAFPKYLPYRIGGLQRGLYGRFGAERKFGNFGLNVLHYNNAPIASTTGITFDFALPVIRNEIEFYGELGRDPFRRNLRTVGFSFPGLYDRTGFEATIEYAHLGNGSTLGAAAPPAELTARVYKRVGRNLNAVVSLSRFSGVDTSFALGLTYGARFNKTGESFSEPEVM